MNNVLNQNAKSGRSESVMAVMQQVQRCPWNPFKLSEIVTLERCLQEATLEDPRINKILRKLGHESVFVEPMRKLKHLSRSEKERRCDQDLKKQTQDMRMQINELEKEIKYYSSKMRDLSEQEAESVQKVDNLRQAITSTESACENAQNDLELQFERVLTSFDASLTVIKVKIPEFISQTLPDSSLLKQWEVLPSCYRRLLIRLITSNKQYHQHPQLAAQLSYCIKKATNTRLRSYLNATSRLCRDLALIDHVQCTEIPEEIEYLKVLRHHIDYLEKPLGDAPKNTTIVYDDLICPERPCGTSAGPPEPIDDPEFSRLFSDLSTRLKSMQNSRA